MRNIQVIAFLFLTLLVGACSDSDNEASGTIKINGKSFPIGTAYYWNANERDEYFYYISFESKGITSEMAEELYLYDFEGTGVITLISYVSDKKDDKLVTGKFEENCSIFSGELNDNQHESFLSLSIGKLTVKKSGSGYSISGDFEQEGNIISVRYTGKLKNGILGL
jgi:hypothetical protein